MAKDPTTLTLSPTKVDTFRGCRRLFKYTYIDQPHPLPENKWFLIGNMAHKVLEELHKKQLSGAKVNWKKDIGKFFKDAADEYHAFDKVAEGVITKSDLYDIKGMLSKYLKYLRNLDELPNVAHVEQLAKLTIDGVVVWLKADRIDQLADGAYKVVDYKSGKPKTKKAELESVQIPSYGLWLQSAFDDVDEIYGEYLYLRYVDSKKGIHTHAITEELMDKTREEYINVDRELKRGAGFVQNFKYKYCYSCDFKVHCLEDENDGV